MSWITVWTIVFLLSPVLKHFDGPLGIVLATSLVGRRLVLHEKGQLEERPLDGFNSRVTRVARRAPVDEIRHARDKSPERTGWLSTSTKPEL